MLFDHRLHVFVTKILYRSTIVLVLSQKDAFHGLIPLVRFQVWMFITSVLLVSVQVVSNCLRSFTVDVFVSGFYIIRKRKWDADIDPYLIFFFRI